MTRNTGLLRYAAIALPAFLLCQSAHAYVGPGAGLGVIGTLIAFLGAIVLAIVGFVWYPVKRLMKKRKQPEAMAEQRQSDSTPAKSEESNSYSQ